MNIQSVAWLCAIVIAAAAGVAGCGGGGSSGGQASCTMIESAPDGGASLKICEELTGSLDIVEGVRRACMADAGAQLGEQFANGPCPRTGALGGCSTTSGSTVITVWYYAGSAGPQTTADVQMMCTGSGDTFVPP